MCLFPLDINGEIGFSFDRRNIQLNENLQAECVVATQSGLMNPRADITWLGPDGSVYNSTSGVPFERVVRGGTEQQEARLPLMFRPFGPADAGEYSCLASITSDDFPGSQTQVYRSLEIPSRGKQQHNHLIIVIVLYLTVDPSTFPTPVYPSRQDNVPVAGQPYIIDCIVDSPDALTNSDVMWISPTGETITDTSPRVFVEDVSPGERPGSWVRRLVFNPLSTEDSGPYTCTSPRGDRVQTLTVNGEQTSQIDLGIHHLSSPLQSPCLIPPFHLYLQLLLRNSLCKLTARRLYHPAYRGW